MGKLGQRLGQLARQAEGGTLARIHFGADIPGRAESRTSSFLDRLTALSQRGTAATSPMLPIYVTRRQRDTYSSRFLGYAIVVLCCVVRSAQ